MNHRLLSLLIICALVAFDWASKAYIREHVSLTDIIPVISPFFNIVHAENPGAAFSLLADAPEGIGRICTLYDGMERLPRARTEGYTPTRSDTRSTPPKP